MSEGTFSFLLFLIGFSLILWEGFRFQKSQQIYAKIEGEVLDVILGNKPDSDFPNLTVATYILVGMRIVNRRPAVVTILDWSLKIQFSDSTPVEVRKIPIPPNMRVEKPSPNILEAPLIVILDQLDQKTKNSPLRENEPAIGWILFELSTTEIRDPKGAQFTVRLTDSLSKTHEIVKEPSPFIETGRILFA